MKTKTKLYLLAFLVLSFLLIACPVQASESNASADAGTGITNSLTSNELAFPDSPESPHELETLPVKEGAVNPPKEEAPSSTPEVSTLPSVAPANTSNELAFASDTESTTKPVTDQVADRVVNAVVPTKPSTPLVKPKPKVAVANTHLVNDNSIFNGGSDSLVARTVGHAEGTRGADGGKNRAYYGHVDPGNGVWNMGTFSYQHGAATPEAADEAWLPVLQRADNKLAALYGGNMTLEERLNGIDLYNQSPAAAATGATAYPIMLAQAKRAGKTGQAAILEARVWSYWANGRWQAAGLGNTEANIRHDQERRMLAIARALAVYQSQLANRIAMAPASTTERVIFTDLSDLSFN